MCCAKSCGQCGGPDCGGADGGASKCCTLYIRDTVNKKCLLSGDTGCVIPGKYLNNYAIATSDYTYSLLFAHLVDI